MGEQGSVDWPADFERLLPELLRAMDLRCRSSGAAQLSEDIQSIVAMELWKGRDRIRVTKRAELFGYIGVAVRREILRARKRAAGKGGMQPYDPTTLAEIAPAREGPPIDLPSVEQLFAAITDETEREVCRLSYEGLTLKEIGERMGFSTTKVFWILGSAEKTLRKKLGVAPPAPRKRRQSDE